MNQIFKKFIDVFFTKGVISALIKWRIFSLSSFKIITHAKRNNVNPKTIIDIGANKGQFSEACFQLFDKVKIIAIEPDANTSKILKKNLSDKNIDIISKVISSRIGTINFQINEDSQVSSVLSLGKDRKKFFLNSKVKNIKKLPVSTLDRVINKRVKKPILIKIDTQGLEYEIIKGAKNILKITKWVILEVPLKKLYKGQKNFDDLNNIMKKNNFSLTGVLNFHNVPNSDEIMEIDVLYTKKK